MRTRAVSGNPSGTGLSRLIRALVMSRGNAALAAGHAEAEWRDSPAVHLTLRALVDPIGSTTTGSALREFGLAAEFIDLFERTSIFGQLQSAMMEVPFRAQIPVEEAGTHSAGWVAPGGALPVSELDVSGVELQPHQVGHISGYTSELAKNSAPSAERVVRERLVSGLARFVDSYFLGDTAAVADTQPASIGDSAQTHSSSGATLADVVGDLQAMVGLLEAWQAPRWLMPRNVAAYIAGLDGSVFNDLRVMGGTLFGIPVLTASWLPSRVVLLDASQVVYAASSDVEIDAGQEMAVEFDTIPTEGTSPTEAARLVSMFQRDLVGVRVLRYLSWRLVRGSAAVVMDVSYP